MPEPLHDQLIPYDWDKLMAYPSDPTLLVAYFNGEEDGRQFIADCGGHPDDWGDATDIIVQLCELHIPAADESSTGCEGTPSPASDMDVADSALTHGAKTSSA